MFSSFFKTSDDTLGVRHLFLLGEFKGIVESDNQESMKHFIQKNETLFIKKIVLGKYHCNLLHILCYGDNIPFTPPDFVNKIVNIKKIIKDTIQFFEKHYKCFKMIPETYFKEKDSDGNTPLDIANKQPDSDFSQIKNIFCKRFGGQEKAINQDSELVNRTMYTDCENSASKTQSAGTKKRKILKKKKRNTYKRKFKNLKKKNK